MNPVAEVTASSVDNRAKVVEVAPLSIGIVLGQLDIGGSESQAINLAAGLLQKGHRVELFSFRDGPHRRSMEERNIPFVLPRRPLSALLTCIKWLRRFRPQLVYTFTFRAHLWGRLAARLLGTPVIVTGYRQSRYYWFDRFSLSWNQALICNCFAVGELVQRRYHHLDHLVHVIPNGVKPALLQADIGEKVDPSGIGLDSRDSYIVLSARLHPNKDHRTALLAFQLVNRERTDVHLLLLGQGPLEARLRREVKALGLEKHVHFLGAKMEVQPFLTGARLGWLTSLVEGLPNAVLEYMACALPVVATKAGGIGEVLSHGKQGFLVEQGDYRGLARYTLQILADEDLRLVLGGAGRQLVRRQYTSAGMVDRSEELLRKLISSQAAPQ